MRKLLFDPTKEENEYSIWKSTKVYTAFLFMGRRILKRDHWRQSRIIEIERFKLLSIKDNKGRFT